jgi:hypothetical protein
MSAPSVRAGFVAVVPGRFELDEFLAEQAGLADVGHGVGGQVDVPVDEQDDFGLPVVGVGEFDGFHPADGDVVDLHRRVRHEVEYVVEVRRDPIGMIAEVGAAGQVEVVEAAELRGTAGGRQQARRRGSGRDDAGESFHRPPPEAETKGRYSSGVMRPWRVPLSGS